jgi:hypothetical protein
MQLTRGDQLLFDDDQIGRIRALPNVYDHLDLAHRVLPRQRPSF